MGRETIVMASGYFDPLHRGHVEYLRAAKALVGDAGRLIVIVNSDHQAKLKKGFVAIAEADRMAIVAALRCVDGVVLSVDTDKTVCKTLALHKPHIFAKGGDRHSGEIPEGAVCKELGIRIVDGLGEKVDSSSRINQAVAGRQP